MSSALNHSITLAIYKLIRIYFAWKKIWLREKHEVGKATKKTAAVLFDCIQVDVSCQG